MLFGGISKSNWSTTETLSDLSNLSMTDFPSPVARHRAAELDANDDEQPDEQTDDSDVIEGLTHEMMEEQVEAVNEALKNGESLDGLDLHPKVEEEARAAIEEVTADGGSASRSATSSGTPNYAAATGAAANSGTPDEAAGFPSLSANERAKELDATDAGGDSAGVALSVRERMRQQEDEQ